MDNKLTWSTHITDFFKKKLCLEIESVERVYF